MIKTVGLSKSYYLGKVEVKAVEKVNLEIKKGEYVSILGPSGCGKSTLMYLLGLLETPTAGKVFLKGKDVSGMGDKQLSRIRNRSVGFVFQTFNLINKFTVWENVLLPTRYFKGEQLDFNPQKRAEELLKQMGIWERREFFPNKISGGQQQRAAIARALMMKPEIILADEPTGDLDSQTGEEIMDLIAKMNRETGVTVVVVTHEKPIADKTEREIYMVDGRLKNGN